MNPDVKALPSLDLSSASLINSRGSRVHSRGRGSMLNTLGCRLSCKKKSIKRKSCFEEQTPFCGLLLVSLLNACLEYRLNEVSCAYLHFLSVLRTSCVKHFFSAKSSQTKTKRATILFFLFPLLLLSSSFLFRFLLSFSFTSRFSSLLSAKIPPFGPFSPKWL